MSYIVQGVLVVTCFLAVLGFSVATTFCTWLYFTGADGHRIWVTLFWATIQTGDGAARTTIYRSLRTLRDETCAVDSGRLCRNAILAYNCGSAVLAFNVVVWGAAMVFMFLSWGIKFRKILQLSLGIVITISQFVMLMVFSIGFPRSVFVEGNEYSLQYDVGFWLCIIANYLTIETIIGYTAFNDARQESPEPSKERKKIKKAK